MARRGPPRYDLPRAAPGPLRLVQLFVNTTDHEHGRELLGTPAQVESWFAEQGLPVGRLGPSDMRRMRALRAAVHELIATGTVAPELSEAARRARLTIDFGDRRLAAEAGGVDGALGVLLGVVYDAMRDGKWSRLKACRNCSWAYWDASRNRSAAWCSMALCGNRLKVRRHRERAAG